MYCKKVFILAWGKNHCKTFCIYRSHDTASYVWMEKETEIFLNIKREKKNPSNFSVWKQQRNPDPRGRGASPIDTLKKSYVMEKRNLCQILEHPWPCFLELLNVRDKNMFFLSRNITQWMRSHFAILFYRLFQNIAWSFVQIYIGNLASNPPPRMGCEEWLKWFISLWLVLNNLKLTQGGVKTSHNQQA